ncbi:MAG: hypothetical protein BWY60_00790 [Actinobacteria bacterium ADurb.Bin346]|nr:MAG: hypothetical protein BWY60_00790 [Actinobacteria bacterium ADurb.Bin346]
MEPLNKNNSKIEVILSCILITGVAASLLLMAAGMILLYLESGSFNISREPSMFIQGNNFFNFILDIFKGRGPENTALLLLTIGTIILMLTPFIRVVASLIYFIWIRDKKYIFITLVVLIILIITLSLH